MRSIPSGQVNSGETAISKGQLRLRIRQLTNELAQRNAQFDALQNAPQELVRTCQPADALLAQIVKQTALAISIVRHPDWIIEFANPAMDLLCDCPEAQLVGQPLFAVLPQAGQALEQTLLEVAHTGQSLVSAEYALPYPPDSMAGTRYLELRCDPFPDSDGAVNRIILTVTDVTTRVYTRQRAEKLLAEKRELHQLEANFMTLASHEFRTPMGTILSSASLIGRYTGADEADKRERHVQRIKTAVYGLNELITDFLALGKLDQPGEARLLVMPFFCADVLAMMQDIAKPDQRFIYRHLAGEPAVTIDGNLLKQILVNLLVNASRYSSEGKAIELTTRITGQLLLIQVRDEGIGIPEEDKANLFVNFFRSRNAVHVQGTGLGLYIVKRYVDLLGGTITFTSQLQRGTVFTVQLPI